MSTSSDQFYMHYPPWWESDEHGRRLDVCEGHAHFEYMKTVVYNKTNKHYSAPKKMTIVSRETQHNVAEGTPNSVVSSFLTNVVVGRIGALIQWRPSS